MKPKPSAKRKTQATKAIGRPSQFSRAVADRICIKIAEGRSLRSICRDPGSPSIDAVMRWLGDETKADFRQQYARAREAQADRLAEEILEIADDGTNDTYVDENGNTRTDQDVIARSRLRVDARKWLASKMAPKKYGDKLLSEHTGADGGPINQSLSVVFVDPPQGQARADCDDGV
ncbi:MAG: hypothetical protein ABFD89_23630 [Bryobacteraceae bacterium]